MGKRDRREAKIGKGKREKGNGKRKLQTKSEERNIGKGLRWERQQWKRTNVKEKRWNGTR